ncbi:hypothetical protein Goshw_020166 [Gossypium schwendimanii]|uniref:Uncharacterized protein n=1 Tax=Gossypium schwendimanii TaxID=34291 RepID=A0A7J9M5T1_GOSSC|nr:hypothetical protein [Gossypium schwendimanii]
MAGALPTTKGVKDHKIWKGIFAVSGIMVTLVIYGVLQEKIMRVPYGLNKEYFKYSLFLVFCNRITTSAVSAVFLLASKKALVPVAPIYKYCLISVSNILTTTCQYEALKYVSFPVQTLAKCAKMIPVMIWGTFIMQKTYKGFDYLVAFLVTLGLLLQGHLLSAIDFVYGHSDCFLDIVLLSTVATVSQFFISYTIRTFGALTFAAVMTTRQVIVFGSLYSKNFLKKASTNPPPLQPMQDGAPSPVKGIP